MNEKRKSKNKDLVVIEENTIYEIDMECIECRNKKKSLIKTEKDKWENQSERKK